MKACMKSALSTTMVLLLGLGSAFAERSTGESLISVMRQSIHQTSTNSQHFVLLQAISNRNEPVLSTRSCVAQDEYFISDDYNSAVYDVGTVSKCSSYGHDKMIIVAESTFDGSDYGYPGTTIIVTEGNDGTQTITIQSDK